MKRRIASLAILALTTTGVFLSIKNEVSSNKNILDESESNANMNMRQEVCVLIKIDKGTAIVENTRQELYRILMDEDFDYKPGEKMWVNYTDNNKKEISEGMYEVKPDSIFPSETSETYIIK